MVRIHTVKEAKDLTIPVDTILRARLIEIKENEYIYDGQTIKNYQWWFEVTTDGPYRGRKVRGVTDREMTIDPRNKLHSWSEAVGRQAVPLGKNFDIDELIGCQADITVGHRLDSKDPAKKYEYIDEVIPIDLTFDLRNPGPPPF
jgi:hypothetical protein